MATESEKLVCPVCGASQKSNGEPFSSAWALALHIAGKAKTVLDSHRSTVLGLLPGIDLARDTINQIGDQILFEVQQALTYKKEQDQLSPRSLVDINATIETAQANRNELAGDVQGRVGRYTNAYSILWGIETDLHKFIATRLQETLGEMWWQKGLPNKLITDCLERASGDENRVSLYFYVELLELREIIKHNNALFEIDFAQLKAEYKDPGSYFHSTLLKVNKIRNNVMHPLRLVAPSEEDMATLEAFQKFVHEFTRTWQE